jgi:hypothetical protein
MKTEEPVASMDSEWNPTFYRRSARGAANSTRERPMERPKDEERFPD